LGGKFISIAIDGPSGAGKSSLAKNLAEKLGFAYLDTGALYRAVGLYIAENNGGYYNTDKLANLVIDVIYENGVQKVFLNGDDVSGKIRENHVSKYASDVSKINKVREFLLKIQRETAEKNNVVMDGRDIGTVVFPNAELKIFVTASPEVRAKRRYDELLQNEQNADYQQVLNGINERDHRDTNRVESPLRKADDALFFDNSNITREQQFEIVKKWFEEKVKN